MLKNEATQQRSQKQPAHTWKKPPDTPATLKNKRHSDETKRHSKTLQNTLHHRHLHSLEVAYYLSSLGSTLHSYGVVLGEPPTWNYPSSFPPVVGAASGSPALLHPFRCYFPFLVLINSCNFCDSSIPSSWLSTVQLAPELHMSTLVVVSFFAANFLPL